MERALELARGGLESVSPNPLVGAVVVRKGRVLGEGFHRVFGGAHAEVEALGQVGDARGADVYVNLEPCGHHGKTPPCAQACVDARVARVIYAAKDPNPLTRGVGPKLLRAHGVEVHSGLLRKEALRLNAPYYHGHAEGRPWVLLKWAMSLDGKIATAGGESQWITGRPSRAHAHGLRRRVDAVLVGTGTALADDPRLTPRPARGRRPWRVVLDRRGRLPLELGILSPETRRARSGRRLIITSTRAAARRRRELEPRGLHVVGVSEQGGRLALDEVLAELFARDIRQVLVEGGSELAGAFVAASLVDEVAAYIAPKLIGGGAAPSPVGGDGVAELDRALAIDWEPPQVLGADVFLGGRVRR